jgi:ComF family protein
MGVVAGMFKRLVAPFIQVIFPHQCRSCLALIVPSDVFCADCIAAIKPIVSAYLPISKTTTLPVIALSAYTDPMRPLLLKKLQGDRLAAQQLATLLLQMSPLVHVPIDVIVPVPLHWTRYAWRGFNQAVEMGRVIAKARQVPLRNYLARMRKTAFQSSLSADERQGNVRGAFTIHPWYQWQGLAELEGKHVIIVDDLCTTGATLVQVARQLLPYKPASVTAVVACRVV